MRAHFRIVSARLQWNVTEVTKISRTRGFILVSLLAMAVVSAGSSIILPGLAQDQETAPDPQLPPREPPWMSQLTYNQKEQIRQLVDSLRESGATPQEIRDAINVELQEWGIEVPEVPARQPPWMSQLTDDQKEEIQQLIDSLRESGASQEEIRDAINAKLQDWSIEVPAPPESSGQLPREPPWMSQLTHEQKEEIQQLIDSLKASGATPQEIRDAINAKLQEWGIELPARPQSSGQ